MKMDAYHIGVLAGAVFSCQARGARALARSQVQFIALGQRPPAFAGLLRVIDEERTAPGPASALRRFQQSVSVAVGFLLYGPTPRIVRADAAVREAMEAARGH